MTTKKYFGTDGIRGRAGEPPITAEFMVALGRAAGRVLTNAHRAVVAIGKDTRVSGYMLESALEATLEPAEETAALLVFMFPQQIHGKGRNQRVAEHIASQHREDHRFCEGHEEIPGNAAKEKHRQKDNADAQR